MARIIAKKTQKSKRKTVDAREFTKDELGVFAMARSLAGAIKSIHDISIVGSDGKASEKLEDKYCEIDTQIPSWESTCEKMFGRKF